MMQPESVTRQNSLVKVFKLKPLLKKLTTLMKQSVLIDFQLLRIKIK